MLDLLRKYPSKEGTKSQVLVTRQTTEKWDQYLYQQLWGQLHTRIGSYVVLVVGINLALLHGDAVTHVSAWSCGRRFTFNQCLKVLQNSQGGCPLVLLWLPTVQPASASAMFTRDVSSTWPWMCTAVAGLKSSGLGNITSVCEHNVNSLFVCPSNQYHSIYLD